MDDIARIAFDHAPVGIVMTRHRVIEACNQTFCDLSGYGMDALLLVEL